MAHGLYADSPAFREALVDCAAALDPFTGWSLIDTLTGQDDTWLERVDMVQPALFAMMTSLARLWMSYGVQPAAVIGHSQGEIAAAHIAGVLSWPTQHASSPSAQPPCATSPATAAWPPSARAPTG